MLVGSGPQVAVALKSATATIPIVFVAVLDPVGMGLVQSLSRPGGNITGFATSAAYLTGKQIEILRELIPGASKIAILANPGNPILPTAEAHADAALMMTIGRVDRFVMGLGEIGHSGGRLQRPDNTSASALRSPVGCVTTPPQTQD